jgi:ketosteroid isomerase-like protein
VSAASEQNVGVIRRLLDTVNRGGSKAVLEHIEEWADPEVEWAGVAAGTDAPGGHVVYRGYEGMRRFWEETDEVFERIHFEDRRVEAVGDEVVVALVRVAATGHGSGLPLEQEIGVVYRLRDGRVRSGEDFTSYEEALSHARELARGGTK